MDWAYNEEESNILIIVDPGSGWMRQSPHGRCHTLFVNRLWESWGPAYISYRQCSGFYQLNNCHVVTGSRLHQFRESNLQTKE